MSVKTNADKRWIGQKQYELRSEVKKMNSVETQEKVDKAGKLLQIITDYKRESGSLPKKVRFPRKYICRAGPIQKKFTFVSKEHLKKSLSYNFILVDVFRWLLNITDIDYTAKRMLIKNCIVVFCSICESMMRASTKGVIGKKHNFKPRTKRMETKEIITEDLRSKLDWLWDKRQAIHIYLISQPEDGTYKFEDYKKARSATYELLDALQIWARKS